MSSGKKNVKDYYFNMLGYCTVFARKRKKVHDAFESATLSEMK